MYLSERSCGNDDLQKEYLTLVVKLYFLLESYHPFKFSQNNALMNQ